MHPPKDMENIEDMNPIRLPDHCHLIGEEDLVNGDPMRRIQSASVGLT